MKVKHHFYFIMLILIEPFKRTEKNVKWKAEGIKQGRKTNSSEMRHYLELCVQIYRLIMWHKNYYLLAFLKIPCIFLIFTTQTFLKFSYRVANSR